MAFDLYFNHRRTFLTKTDWTATFSFEVQPRNKNWDSISDKVKVEEETRSRRKKSKRKADLWPWEKKTNEFIKSHDGTRKAFTIEILGFDEPEKFHQSLNFLFYLFWKDEDLSHGHPHWSMTVHIESQDRPFSSSSEEALPFTLRQMTVGFWT